MNSIRPSVIIPPPARRARTAFTLIELLTVIAIIGILAAILIPVVGKVRDSAHSAKTTSNLRQLFQANKLHAADYKGLFVPDYTLASISNGGGRARPYDNPVFMGYIGNERGNAWSERQTMFQSGKPGANNDGAQPLSLGQAHGFWTLANEGRSFRESEVDAKAPRMILFGDSCGPYLSGSSANNSPDAWDDSRSDGWDLVAFRHGGRGHFVLANGAVVKLTKAEATAPAAIAQYWPQTAASPWSPQVLTRSAAPY